MPKYLELHTHAIYKAYADYKKALAQLQDSCEHKTILEAGREESTFFNDLPYIRICEDCGLQEKSRWGSCWTTLVGRAYRVERNEVYKQRPIQTYIPEELRE